MLKNYFFLFCISFTFSLPFQSFVYQKKPFVTIQDQQVLFCHCSLEAEILELWVSDALKEYIKSNTQTCNIRITDDIN